MKNIKEFFVNEALTRNTHAKLSLKKAKYVYISLEGEEVVSFKSERALLDYLEEFDFFTEDDLDDIKADILDKMERGTCEELGGTYEGGILVKLID